MLVLDDTAPISDAALSILQEGLLWLIGEWLVIAAATSDAPIVDVGFKLMERGR